VESEFCVASGARLNRDKTRVLPIGEHDGELPEVIAGAAVLRDGDRVKSLGAIYSTRADAPGRLPEVLSKMERRLAHLMKHDPSLLGRALVANTLLSSCLWYFLQFEALTAPDAERVSDLIWRCLWMRSEQAAEERVEDEGAAQPQREPRVRGKVSRAQAAAPLSAGGLSIIEPAVMAKALYARSVNLLLEGRGQWWAVWSEAIIERAALTGPGTGTDGLAVAAAHPLIIANATPYWAAAVKAWGELQLEHDAAQVQGLTPARAGGEMVVLQARCHASATAPLRAGLDCLTAAGIQYLSDTWDHRQNQRQQTMPVVQRTYAQRMQAGLSEQQVINAYAFARHLLDGAAAVTLMRAAGTTAPAPGSFHRLRGEAASVVVVLTMGAGSSACTRCTAQRAASVRRVDLSSGRGALPSATQLAAAGAQLELVCACRLSPLLIDNDSVEAWGEAETTALIPRLLQNEKELTTSSTVAELRACYNVRMFPASAQRPPCEAAWVQSLPAPPPTKEEWEQLWRALNAAQVDGRARSLAWLVLHRRRPLLSNEWLRRHLCTTATCRLCTTGEEETLEHLFHTCPSAQATWARVAPWMAAVGLAAAVSSLEGRLLGRAAPHWPTVTALWAGAEEQPDREEMRRWMSTAWAEVRCIVLHALWIARCKVLYARVRRERAVAEARGMIRYMLTYLSYRYLPSRCPFELPCRGQPPRGERLAFLSILWRAFDTTFL
jgi:hypothetical protein